MPSTRLDRWRIAMIVGGATMAAGGAQHPDSDPAGSMREELAWMTSQDSWDLAHLLIAVGTGLLVFGLWSALRNRTWPPPAARALRVLAVAMSAYLVETVFHLGAAIDADALARGDFAPVASTHLALSLVLYPVSGLALAWFNARLFPSLTTPARVFAVVGVLGGLLHASSLLVTIALSETETTPLFASAGMLIAAWSLGSGISGLPLRAAGRARVTRPTPSAVPAG